MAKEEFAFAVWCMNVWDAVSRMVTCSSSSVSRKLMKLLHAEDGGLVMYVKRLEAGCIHRWTSRIISGKWIDFLPNIMITMWCTCIRAVRIIIY